jgi:hypothetical protein
LYAGQLNVGDHEVTGELWHSGGTAVVYLPDQSILGPMRDCEVTTDGVQLVLMGTVDGEPVVWKAVEPTRIEGTWRNSAIALDGQLIEAQLVQQTNHGVTVQTGSDSYQLSGAKVRTLGGRSAQIVQPDGTVLAMTLPKRGCGCSGK